MRGKCSILSDITGLIRSTHASFLPLSIIFAPGSGPRPGRSRWQIMQADNASSQSITLMARTTMPRRFRTNFRLLQLSICTRGSQPERCKRKGGGMRASGYLCFLSALLAFGRFYWVFSSASEHNDETKSVASVQPTGHSVNSTIRLLDSGSFDLSFQNPLPSFCSISHHLAPSVSLPFLSSHTAS